MYDLLENWLRHKSDMVNIEAARAICDMRNVTATELYRPVAGSFSPSFPLSLTPSLLRLSSPAHDQSSPLSLSVLQLFLTSPKPALKFAAIRTLNKLAQSHPAAVASCNHEMENMITDQNRSMATYAITTLLKVRLLLPFLSQSTRVPLRRDLPFSARLRR